MTTDPIHDAERHNEELDANSDAAIAAENEIEAEIMRLVEAGDMSAIVQSAPWVHQRRYTAKGECVITKRQQTLGEVLFDSLDFTDGPMFNEIMGLLRHAPDSRPLFARLARQFAAKRPIF